jgi:hypothetical protein
MNFQLLVVALLVALCFAYAAWTLMPQVLRAPLAKGLLRLPLPTFVRQRLLRAAVASAGCGCSGCDKAPAAAKAAGNGTLTAQAQPIVFHRRKKSEPALVSENPIA